MTAHWRLFRELVDLSGKVHISPQISNEREMTDDRLFFDERIESVRFALIIGTSLRNDNIPRRDIYEPAQDGSNRHSYAKFFPCRLSSFSERTESESKGLSVDRNAKRKENDTLSRKNNDTQESQFVTRRFVEVYMKSDKT
jgi:hypothetical protein